MVRASLVPLFAVSCALVAQAPAEAAKRLSLQEAITTALQNNLAVDIARQTREITASGVTSNWGLFDWNLNASLSTSRQDDPAGNTSPAGTTTERAFSADVTKLFTWGGSLDVKYAPGYSSFRPDGGASSAEPWSGNASATYTQNLLQGFGREMTLAPVVVAQKNAQAADFTFQQSIIDLVSKVEGYYWDLVYAERFLASKKTSLELAQKQLKENTIRMQVGTMAPIDVTSAEAQVAQAEQDIISAEAQLANAKDTLVRALYPNAERPAALATTDNPTLSHIQLDESAAVKMALERRVELKAARIGKDVATLQAKVAQNKTLPTLAAFAGYSGLADNHDRFSPVNSDLAGSKFPGYNIGVRLAMPIQNRAAKGALSAARAQLRSSELGLRDQELSVTLQVRTALRNVEAAEKGVKAAEKTRYYQQKNLEAEQKKFENGMSTNFVVLQVMTNLDNARSAELLAQINYAKAVTALETAVGNLMEARNLVIK